MRAFVAAFLVLVCGGLLFTPQTAVAAAPPAPSAMKTPGFNSGTGGVLNSIVLKFEQQTITWVKAIEAVAQKVFLFFATVALCWMGFELITGQVDWGRFFHEVMKFILTTGIFFMFLKKGPDIATSIIHGFVDLGGMAVHQAIPMHNTYGASELVNAAGNIWAVIWNALSSFKLLEDDPLGVLMVLLLVGVVASVVCLLMAVEVMIAWIQAYAVMYAGVFFLAFGGGPWLRDIAIGYWKTILSKGAFLFGVILSVNLFLQMSYTTLQQIEMLSNQAAAAGFFSDKYQMFQPHLVGALLEYTIEAVLCYLVLTRLPKMLAQLPFGGGTYGGHGIAETAVGMAGAAAGGAFGAAAGGAAGEAAGAIGGGSGKSGGTIGGPSGGSSGGGGGSVGGGGAPGPMVDDAVVAAASMSGAPTSAGSQVAASSSPTGSGSPAAPMTAAPGGGSPSGQRALPTYRPAAPHTLMGPISGASGLGSSGLMASNWRPAAPPPDDDGGAGLELYRTMGREEEHKNGL